MFRIYTYCMRILLTDGAGLTSRQVATRLDQLGHEVSAAVSDAFCAARLGGEGGRVYGTLPAGVDSAARPQHAQDQRQVQDAHVAFGHKLGQTAGRAPGQGQGWLT